MKILEIEPESPLFGYVRPGYSLDSINGSKVQDVVDFRYKTSEERVEICFLDNDGKAIDFRFDDYSALELGLTLDDHRIKFCKNDCIFCFVMQQPQGMRRTLYFKDEDYRLSFTHGNFVTLSNTTEADIERIIKQRLSPLYVSVHATDDKLRRCMLRNEKLAPIVPRLKQLTENGITVHSQVVLCPGINDGPQLEKTINDLSALFPGVKTLAVVPLGLTKYRENLSKLRTYTRDEAKGIIRSVEKIQRRFLKQTGSRFVWVADEFYIVAGETLPSRSHYEEMDQFENGIGMVREFIINFNRRRRYLKNLRRDRRVLMLTGASAFPVWKRDLLPYLKEKLRLSIEVALVPNRFWGEMVTVSGLLTGQDLLRYARARKNEFDLVVLPPNCLNGDDLFLDNLTLSQFKETLGLPVLIGRYDLAATLREALS